MKQSTFLTAIRAVFLVSPLLVVCASTAVAHETYSTAAAHETWDWPTPDITGSNSALSTTTTDIKDDLSDKSVLPPIVVPLEWSGGPIDAKMLLIGGHLDFYRRYSYAVVDLLEGVVKIYPRGHHHIADEGLLAWASFTPHGDVLIYYKHDQQVIYFIPDGDFSQEPTIIRPRRFGPRLLGHQAGKQVERSNRIYAFGDKSRSMVWVSQTSVIPPKKSEGNNHKETTWIDLMKVDNSEIVMTVHLEGRYRISGLLDDGLLVTGIKDKILISSDGSIRRFVACSSYHRDDLSSPSFTMAVHNQYYACLKYGRLFIMDINTGRLYTLPAPDQGSSYIPHFLYPYSGVYNDNFFPVSSWTPHSSWDDPKGPWDSAYIVSLSEQTVRRVYTRGDDRLRVPIKSIDSRYIIAIEDEADKENQFLLWLFDYQSGHWSKLTVELDDHFIYDIR